MKKIIIAVHAGAAHKDDLLAAGILIAAKGWYQGSYEVIRTNNPTGDEDYILDVGGQYDGVRLFDHHQKEAAVAGECAATLISQAFAPDLLKDSVWGPFLKLVEIQDNGGLRSLDAEFGGNRVAPLLTLEFGLIRLFEHAPTDVAGLVGEIVKDRLEFMRSVKEAGAWLEENHAVVTVGGHAVIELLSNPRAAGLETAVVNAAQGELINKYDAVATYSFDPRDLAGKTRTLFRTRQGEDAGLDFVKSRPKNLVFAHKGGFLLNFIPSDESEYKKLVTEALPQT